MLLTATLRLGTPTSLWECVFASMHSIRLCNLVSNFNLYSQDTFLFFRLQNNKMNQQETTMTLTRRYPRFEITINTDHGSFTHISAAPKQADAVERVVRSYESKNPVLLKVKSLGVIRAKTR